MKRLLKKSGFAGRVARIVSRGLKPALILRLLCRDN
jgi:hypothetical protein